jgi:hypothetical protein
MRSALLITVCVGTCCLPLRSTAADLAPERLLLGFEEDEIKVRILPVVGKFLDYMRPVEGGFDLNDRVGMLGGSGGVGPTWKLRSARASQGRFSLLLSGQKAVAPGDYVFGRGYHFAWDPLNFRPPEKAPDRRPRLDGSYAVVGPFYQQLHLLNYWGGRGLAVSSSAFRHFFPADWSGYDLLRFDVFSEKFANTFRIALEDEDIQRAAFERHSTWRGITAHWNCRRPRKPTTGEPTRPAPRCCPRSSRTGPRCERSSPS